MRKLNIKSAEESDIVFHDHAPVGWRLGTNKPWVIAGLVGFVLGFIVLFFTSQPKVSTPFVTSFIDLLDPKSSWVLASIRATGLLSFLLSALFVLALTVLLHQLFYATVNSSVRELYRLRHPTPEEIKDRREQADELSEDEINKPVKETIRFYRTFKPQRPWGLPTPPFFQESIFKRLLWRLSFFLFLVMLVSNTWLFTYFFKLLQGTAATDLPPTFNSVYIVAILSRLACLFVGASTLLQYFYHDFSVRIGRFMSSYIRYFYPALVSIAIISFVFSKLGQFDAFFIELVREPGQLALFSVLFFPVSIAVIWFGPAYSYFTDQRFAHREDSYSTLHALLSGSQSWWRRWLAPFGWLVFHVRLFLRGDRVFRRLEPPRYYMPLNITKVPPPSVSFTMMRDLLGLFYIFTLISICHKIYFDNVQSSSIITDALPLASLVLVLIYWLSAKTAFRRSEKPQNRAKRIVSAPARFQPFWVRPIYKLRDRSVYKPIGRKFYYVRQQWPFWIGVAALLCFIVFLALTFANSGQENEWYVPFWYFLIFLYASLFFFAAVTLFEPFYKRYTFDKEMLLDQNKKLSAYHPVVKEEENLTCEPDKPKYAPYVYVAPYPDDDAKDGKQREAPPIAGHSPQAKRPPGAWDLIADAIGYTTIQGILLLIAIAVGIFALYFLACLISDQSLSGDFVQNLNPLNVYLLLVNGFIAFIFFVGRWLLVLEQIKIYRFHEKAAKSPMIKGKRKSKAEKQKTGKKYNAISSKHFYQGFVVVLGLLAFSYYGNHYHEVPYRAAEAQAERIDLAEYTERFLNRLESGSDSTKTGRQAPVFLIAADGGGLKACYWTMLHLYQLDSLGLYNDNVFLTSGASGGNMGLSMYTLLKAKLHGKPRTEYLREIKAAIDAIGAENFLSGDFTGLITRFPVNFLPNLPDWNTSELEDRAEAMARAYYKIAGTPEGPFSYEVNRKAPYSKLWEHTDYALPLFITNTTRAEDGMRGFVHPLANRDLAPGMVDLTFNDTLALSFPDAAFLSNRFPIMSPAGRIEGRGHFVDAGNSDNSGISTIMHFLRYMQARASGPDSIPVFGRFFDNRPLVLISIRNDKNRFVRDQFYAEKDTLNRNFRRSELSANSNAAINSGLAGVAYSWDDHLLAEAPARRSVISNFHRINLPFRLDEAGVHAALGGELRMTKLDERVESINDAINTALGCKSGEKCFAVAPPLGRLMAKPSLDYMKAMVGHPDNAKVYRDLRRLAEE